MRASELRSKVWLLLYEQAVDAGYRYALTEGAGDPELSDFESEDPEDRFDPEEDVGSAIRKIDAKLAAEREKRLVGIDPYDGTLELGGVTLAKPSDILKYMKRGQNNSLYKKIEKLGKSVMSFPMVVVNRGGLYTIHNKNPDKPTGADYLIAVSDGPGGNSGTLELDADVEGNSFKVAHVKNYEKEMFPKDWKVGASISLKDMKKWMDAETEKMLKAAKVIYDSEMAREAASKHKKAA